jgi:hypothetical protein
MLHMEKRLGTRTGIGFQPPLERVIGASAGDSSCQTANLRTAAGRRKWRSWARPELSKLVSVCAGDCAAAAWHGKEDRPPNQNMIYDTIVYNNAGCVLFLSKKLLSLIPFWFGPSHRIRSQFVRSITSNSPSNLCEAGICGSLPTT